MSTVWVPVSVAGIEVPGGGRAVDREGAGLGHALLASLVPTTIAGHGFWAIEEPAARKLQRTQCHKNMAMLGGLLFVALDPPRPRNRRGEE
jgi:putative oxidoreductase